MNSGVITPVVCCSSTNLAGIDMLLKEIELLPSPTDNKPVEAYDNNDNIVEISYDRK